MAVALNYVRGKCVAGENVVLVAGVSSIACVFTGVITNTSQRAQPVTFKVVKGTGDTVHLVTETKVPIDQNLEMCKVLLNAGDKLVVEVAFNDAITYYISYMER